MVKTITGANFNALVIQNTKPVILDFFADWCGPCRHMAPLIEQLAGEWSESYFFGKVDIAEDRALAIDHGISAIPTLIFYRNGKQVGAVSGFLSKEEIKAKLVSIFGQ